MKKPAFRNQRVRFRNYSPPYADKVTFDPATPSIGVRPRGGVPSRKNGRVISFWTPGEYAAIVLFEAFQDILSYEERPERVMLRDGPSWFTYVPHFVIRTASGSAIVELSAQGGPRTDRQARVAELARGHYAAKRVGFVELPHFAVRAKPRATGALRLMRYLSVTPSTAEVLRASDVLSLGTQTIAEVETRSEVSHGRLLAMLRTGVIRAAAPGPIDLDLPVSLTSGEARS
jgi:hypothetical protein